MKKLIAIAIVVLASSGCYTVNAKLPGTLRNDLSAEDYEKVGTLNYETSHWYFVYGLVGSPPEDFLSKEIKSQVQSKGADGVANLKYESQAGCMDLLIHTCAGNGCISPRTYKVTGDLVRIKKAPLPGAAPTADAAPPATAPVATTVAY